MALTSSLQACMDPASAHHQGMGGQSLEDMTSSMPSSSSLMQQERRLKPQPEQALKCPRCDSTNTKFCYYNNYSLSQPRYFCKACRRYWTKGGSLRNVPVGGGCRKNKRSTPKKQPDHQNPPSSSSAPQIPSSLELSILGNPNPTSGILGNPSATTNPGFLSHLESLRSCFEVPNKALMLENSNQEVSQQNQYGVGNMGFYNFCSLNPKVEEGEELGFPFQEMGGLQWQQQVSGGDGSGMFDAGGYWNGVGTWHHGASSVSPLM
ncbi:dof zinc finger protein DOF5.3 isoform X1 [Amborella trichopoda]|uniref:Dof zinc finger protein n=2 Tax=Amborella trichopoda TaxID=13333 RepID=W1P4V2_AMBTC|nr:dof zinc finger protein DOF5.3 isoform X1 [Amborella trichopoda]XP_020522191.1 dof zinc finger protein DOF5.3 isoform X1 [Amborella trichopoda]ERN04917.1 hypothetical protein AMTR_s00080p00087770 [Amborella trichopoda]|eukprot:XP_006843242.1 dof zinc finger protein DOF5.3 isoform X1 [Amborella trichopoda]